MNAPTATASHGVPFSTGRDTAPAAGDGPPAHVHPIDERLAVHTVTVQVAAHVLNGYTPGGFEQVIKGSGTPAPRRDLPPAGFGTDPHAAWTQ